MVPDGFTEVTKDQFFALLSEAAVLDPMPCNDAPNHTTWETRKGLRRAWGWSTPGWRNPGEPRRYAVRREPA